MPDGRARTRRELLKMVPLAAAGLLLTARGRSWLLRRGLALSDTAATALFRSSQLAPTFDRREVTPLERFPLNSYLTHDPDVDLDEWHLEVSGLVASPRLLHAGGFQQLPQVVQNTRHICVEGWDAIGNFGGVRSPTFLELVGADRSAAFIEVSCADDYYESVDMASARHPQSLLCHEMYGRPLSREHGAPLRLVMPTKLGYKQAKYVTELKVTNVLPARRGYWEDQGYSWHGGL